MLLHFTVLSAGILTALWSLGILFFRKLLAVEKLLPRSRPGWLMLLCWLYLTLMFCAWAGFWHHFSSITLLGTILVTASAVKMSLILFAYPHMQNVFVLIFKDTRALLIICLSTAMVGFLMVFVSTWIA